MRPTFVWPPPKGQDAAILEVAKNCPFCGGRPVESEGQLRCPRHTQFMLPEEWNRRAPESAWRPTRPLLTAAEDREEQER